jgi:hypothetical protein
MIAARNPESRTRVQALQQAIIFVKKAHPDKNLDSLFEHDLEKILLGGPDPFGIYDGEDEGNGCSWCSY